jgi:hypothetical protein
VLIVLTTSTLPLGRRAPLPGEAGLRPELSPDAQAPQSPGAARQAEQRPHDATGAE